LKIASCVRKQGKVACNIPKSWDPFPDPAYAGALVHRAALFILGKL